MSHASRIIQKFGGVRAMATKVRRPPSTVQDWKNAGVIPARQQQHVLDCARELGIELTPDDFFAPAAAGSAAE